jgi:CubicO group peptidase (beta-lactamase class C family)
MRSRRLLATIVFVICLGLITSALAQAPVPGAAPPDLDTFVAQVMKAFDVPGLSVAIVKDGKVVVAKGYGVRKLGDPAPVDGKTRFGIASNTKVFTATALGLLVEEGKLRWDAPVVQYLPGFQMWDPYVTREITVRDLLVHRSGLGLGAGDLLWWPATSFRSAYAYDNVLYLIAGEVIEAVSGRSWEDFVAERILKKVGMTGSNVRHSDATGSGNVAVPHAEIDGTVRPIKPFDSDNTNPAGGVNSSAEDMAKWVMVQLNEGALPDGTRLFSERTSRELMTIVTPLSVPASYPPEMAGLRMNFHGYALGLDVRDFRGRKMVTHTGGLPGYVSMVSMIPEAKLGVVVLTNQESGEAFDAISYHVLDCYLGFPATDWLGPYVKARAQAQARVAAAEKQATAARNTSSRPSLPPAQYAGTYNDAWYGDIEIANENGKLVMKFGHTPSLVGDLEHWQYDTFIVRWRDRELRADAYVTFSIDPDGRIDQAKMRAVSPATDFSFDFQDLLLRPVGSGRGTIGSR